MFDGNVQNQKGINLYEQNASSNNQAEQSEPELSELESPELESSEEEELEETGDSEDEDSSSAEFRSRQLGKLKGGEGGGDFEELFGGEATDSSCCRNERTRL